MALNKKIYLVIFLTLLTFSIDRITKLLVINHLLEKSFFEIYINDYLNIILIWNKGIAFGLFQNEDTTYHIFSFFIILIIFYLFYLIYNSKFILDLIGYSLITGGAIGNLFDRIYYEAVPDFIDIHYNDFHWFIFNVADICISIGIALVFINIYLEKNENI